MLKSNFIRRTFIESFLERHVQKFPTKPAIIAVNPTTLASETISHQKLQTLVYQTANFLVDLGMKKKDRFAILMENTPEIIIFELAGSLLGATTVPLDFKRDTLDRKIFKIQDTSAKALFIRSGNSLNLEDVKSLKLKFPKLKIITWPDFAKFQKLLPDLRKVSSKSSFKSHYVILYTSGTTAHPKGVLLSLKSCLFNALGIINWQKITEHDRFNIVLPLHHINSTQFCLATLIAGGTIILNSYYSASGFWPVIDKFKATNTSVVPTILHDLLARLAQSSNNTFNIPSLKRMCIGSAPVLPAQTLKFYQLFKVRVIQGYGQTETALRVSGVPVDLDEESYKEMIISNSIGISLSFNKLAIMDDKNRRKKEGQEGEICIKGPVLADGYLNDLPSTKFAFKRGWFHSGDLGYFKDLEVKFKSSEKKKLRFFFIVGRIREIIIKGGVNISPSAIEDQLLQAFPQIAEVSVVGFSDERMGEEIAAAIVVKNSVDGNVLSNQILESGKKNNIPGLSIYEIPKKVFILESLPKTSTGKIQRTEVKKYVAELIERESHLPYFVKKPSFVRRINSKERNILQQAVKINNERWSGLPATLEEFVNRAKNGLLFGVFKGEELLGSLSCVQLSSKVVKKLKTWDEVSVKGNLSNNNPKGDCLVCVAISVKSSKLDYKQDNNGNMSEFKLRQLAKKKLNWYVNSDLDHILNFHKQPKFGVAGAKPWKILENGRKEDKDSMGYNILMQYPKIRKTTKIVKTETVSPSIFLIGHALIYAKAKGIKNVIAFSRPAGFRKYLKSII